MKDSTDIKRVPEYNQWYDTQQQGIKLPTYEEWIELNKK